jgi:hypothetical protein
LSSAALIAYLVGLAIIENVRYASGEIANAQMKKVSNTAYPGFANRSTINAFTLAFERSFLSLCGWWCFNNAPD